MPSLLDETLILRRRELELEKRFAELRRANGILAYRPHPKQEAFHAAADFQYRYARTGNRFGKSEMGAAEDVAFAIGYRPWYPEGHPLRTLGLPRHGTKGLIITTDWDKSKEIFTEQEGEQIGKMFKYIPQGLLGQPTRNHSGAIDRIPVRHISGGTSIIHFDTVKSYKQNQLGQESGAADWIHIDEPIPEQMWKALARGLVDRSGKAWFTCTPLSEPWIDNAFDPDPDAKSDSVQFSVDNRWMMTGSMDDNPHNSQAAIDSFMSWLTDDERDCRRNGIPSAYAGVIYKEFLRASHVRPCPPPGWSDWLCPPADHSIRFAIDYHFRKNDAVLFVATAPTGHTYVFHELWKSMMIDEEVELIKSVYGTNTPVCGLVDPLASTPNKINDMTAMEEYLRLGLAVFPATKDPVNGIRMVKALLKSRDKHGNPWLQFSPHLSRTLFEVSRGFVWDGEENRPVKKNDDMMENLYRLVLQGLDYVEPSGINDYSAIPRRDEFETVADFSDYFSPRETKPNRSARYRS